MTTFPIRLYGDPALRRRARPVGAFGGDLVRLGDGLIEAMLGAQGAGLAAPQVGVGVRAFALAGTYAGLLDPAEEHDAASERAHCVVYVNPEIVERDGVRVDVEGCLSIPGIYTDVKRAARLVVRYQDVHGAKHEVVAEGNHAKAVQHELDHLDGVLFLDRLGEPERRRLMDEHRAEFAEMQREAKAHLKALRHAGGPSAPWP
ncbi:MAG: peptide deformylase [Trueperaceae bacterium]|nr:peptide deformylase [Trueperaceae bacterium]